MTYSEHIGNVCATVHRCYSGCGHGRFASRCGASGEPALSAPAVSVCTKPYRAAFDKNPHRVADAGRVRLGGYAPSLGPPRR